MDDCYYFLYSTCERKNCTFRHSPLALESSTVCRKWAADKKSCTDENCAFRHSTFHKKKDFSSMQCYWENTDMGCKKKDCEYKHTKDKIEHKHEYEQNNTITDKHNYSTNFINMDEKYSHNNIDINKNEIIDHELKIIQVNNVNMFKMYKNKKSVLNDIDFIWHKQYDLPKSTYTTQENGEYIYKNNVKMFIVHMHKKCLIDDITHIWNVNNPYQHEYCNKTSNNSKIIYENNLPTYYVINNKISNIKDLIEMHDKIDTKSDLNLIDLSNDEIVSKNGKNMYRVRNGRKCILDDISLLWKVAVKKYRFDMSINEFVEDKGRSEINQILEEEIMCAEDVGIADKFIDSYAHKLENNKYGNNKIIDNEERSFCDLRSTDLKNEEVRKYDEEILNDYRNCANNKKYMKEKGNEIKQRNIVEDHRTLNNMNQDRNYNYKHDKEYETKNINQVNNYKDIKPRETMDQNLLRNSKDSPLKQIDKNNLKINNIQNNDQNIKFAHQEKDESKPKDSEEITKIKHAVTNNDRQTNYQNIKSKNQEIKLKDSEKTDNINFKNIKSDKQEKHPENISKNKEISVSQGTAKGENIINSKKLGSVNEISNIGDKKEDIVTNSEKKLSVSETLNRIPTKECAENNKTKLNIRTKNLINKNEKDQNFTKPKKSRSNKFNDEPDLDSEHEVKKIKIDEAYDYNSNEKSLIVSKENDKMCKDQPTTKTIKDLKNNELTENMIKKELHNSANTCNSLDVSLSTQSKILNHSSQSADNNTDLFNKTINMKQKHTNENDFFHFSSEEPNKGIKVNHTEDLLIKDIKNPKHETTKDKYCNDKKKSMEFCVLNKEKNNDSTFKHKKSHNEHINEENIINQSDSSSEDLDKNIVKPNKDDIIYVFDKNLELNVDENNFLERYNTTIENILSNTKQVTFEDVKQDKVNLKEKVEFFLAYSRSKRKKVAVKIPFEFIWNPEFKII